MKLILAQFKRGTKEQEYLVTMQSQSYEDFDKIV